MIDDVNGARHGVPQPVAPAPSTAPTPQTRQFVDHATKSAHDDWKKSAEEYEHAARHGSRNQGKLLKAMIDKAGVYEYWLQQKLRIDKLTGGNAAVKSDVKQINGGSNGDRYVNGISSQITGQAQSTVLGESTAHARTEMDFATVQATGAAVTAARQHQAAIPQIPLAIRRAEPSLVPDARQAVAQAEQDNYKATLTLETGLIDEAGLPANYTPDDLKAAKTALKAAHQGENIGDLIDGLDGGLAINSKLQAINPNDPNLSPVERNLAVNDPVTLAFAQSQNISLNPKDYSTTDTKASNYLSPQELELMNSNPLLFTQMRLGEISIRADTGSVNIDAQVGGKTVSQKPAGQVETLVEDALRSGNWRPNIGMLMLGSDAVRLNYSVPQMQQMMSGTNPDAQKALKFLQANYTGMFFPGSQDVLWQQGGLPYFNSQWVGSQLDSLMAKPNPSSPNYARDSQDSTIYADKAGKWMQQTLQSATPELANIMLDTVKQRFNKDWYHSNQYSDVLPKMTDFYKGLSMAIELAPDRAGEFASWLMAPSGPQNGVMADVRGSGTGFGYQSVRDTVANGNGDKLSRAILQQMKGEVAGGNNNTSESALYEFQTMFDQGAQKCAANNGLRVNEKAFSTFISDPGKSLNPYFGHFQSASNIGTAQKITSDKQLTALVGTAFGFTPSYLAANPSAMAAVSAVVEWIHKEGGQNPTVTAVPIVYASKTAGVNSGAIFEIAKPDGSLEIIDGTAALNAVQASPNQKINPDDVNFKWHYSNFTAFEQQNTYDDSGYIYLYTDFLKNPGQTDWNTQRYAAHITTWQEHAEKWAGFGAGVAMLAGGILFAPVTAGGSLTVSAAAGGLLLGAGFVTSVSISADHLDELDRDGASIGLGNPAARDEWLNIAGSGLSVVPLVSTAGAVNKAAGLGGSGVALVLGTDQTVNLVQNWGQMSGEDQTLGVLSLGLDAGFMGAGFMSPKVEGASTAEAGVKAPSGGNGDAAASRGGPGFKIESGQGLPPVTGDGTVGAPYTGGKELMPWSPGEMEVWNGDTGRTAPGDTQSQADNVRYVAVTNDGVALMLRRGQPIPPDFHGARIFAVGPDGTAVQLRSVQDLPPAAGAGEAAAPYTGGKELALRPKAEVEVWSGNAGEALQTGQVHPSIAEDADFTRIFVASLDGTLDNVRGNPDDAHRVESWQLYLDSGRTRGYAHWARGHDVNQTQATRAAKAVAAYHQTLGWGRTEVTVHVEIDGVQYARRLDIADNDPTVLKGIEVKIGRQTLTTGKEGNEWEIARDKALVENGWDIQWVFRDLTKRPSQNLLDALDEAHIGWTIEGYV